MLNDEQIDTLLQWWSGANQNFKVEESLDSDFFFESGFGRLDRNEFQIHIENSGKWSNVTTIALFTSELAAAFFFEATDEVTLLRHRKGWLIQSSNNKLISSIFETSALLPKEDSK